MPGLAWTVGTSVWLRKASTEGVLENMAGGQGLELVDLRGTHNDQTYQFGSRRVTDSDSRCRCWFLKYIVVRVEFTPKIGEIRSF